jgi:hypothetical protein
MLGDVRLPGEIRNDLADRIETAAGQDVLVVVNLRRV